jgi:hypothetical protein|tara:strand:- start:2031 stop:2372 length:342 start_codon:yes stop_codon:yes gene_type:complete
MELFTCEVNLGGDMKNTVVMNLVTAPELEVLRRVHGHDAVWGITRTGDADYPDNDAERETLQLKYGYEIVNGIFGPYGKLPEKLSELKIPVEQVIAADLPSVTTNIERKEAVS